MTAQLGPGSLNTTANLPVNGTVTYTINATVCSGVPTGGQLDNTASLTIPGLVSDYNPGDDSASASVSVAATPPATGNKPLYLYGASGYDLSRTPPSTTPSAVTISNQGTNYQEWTLSPALQQDDTISNSAVSGATAVPVQLICGRQQPHPAIST